MSTTATASLRIWDTIFKPIIASYWVEGALPWVPAAKDLVGSPFREPAGRSRVTAMQQTSFTGLR